MKKNSVYLQITNIRRCINFIYRFPIIKIIQLTLAIIGLIILGVLIPTCIPSSKSFYCQWNKNTINTFTYGIIGIIIVVEIGQILFYYTIRRKYSCPSQTEWPMDHCVTMGSARIGQTVQRGPQWIWGDEDEETGFGQITKINLEERRCTVRWEGLHDIKIKGHYRMGPEFDLCYPNKRMIHSAVQCEIGLRSSIKKESLGLKRRVSFSKIMFDTDEVNDAETEIPIIQPTRSWEEIARSAPPPRRKSTGELGIGLSEDYIDFEFNQMGGE